MTALNEIGEDSSRLDVAGKIMTVRGPIDPAHLGATLMHEHIFVDLRKGSRPAADAPTTEMALWEQKVTLENLHLARERKPIADNCILEDEETATEEVIDFRNWGGGAIVDATSVGIHRDPAALLRVSQASDVHVIMGSGWYVRIYHPADMDQRSVEEMTAEIVGDVTVGVGGTGIHSGIIGEVGIYGGPLTPNEVKSIRASARASRLTGAAISFHSEGGGREKFDAIDILREEGADLSRVVFGHSDSIAVDMEFMLELLGHGVYIQFDNLGRVGVTLEANPPVDDDSAAARAGRTAAAAGAIPRLVEAGYVDRILLSQDVCRKFHLKRYGGTGYSFVLQTFVPHLRSRGVSEDDVRAIVVDNPRRLLALSEPMS